LSTGTAEAYCKADADRARRHPNQEIASAAKHCALEGDAADQNGAPYRTLIVGRCAVSGG